MRSIRGDGVWTDSDGVARNASVEIAIDGLTARVTVAAMDDAGVELPTADRRIAYFLGRVEQQIRNVEYGNRTIKPDPKPGAAKRKPPHRR